MKIPMAIMLLFMGFVTQACADSRGGVWVYQPDGGSYRVESRAYQYDPRSPYPQYRQYPQNLPPRYQGQLPPRYYDRHRQADPQSWRHQRHGEYRRHWNDRGRSGIDRPQRWHHDRPQQYGRSPLIRDRGDLRMYPRDFGDRKPRR